MQYAYIQGFIEVNNLSIIFQGRFFPVHSGINGHLLSYLMTTALVCLFSKKYMPVCWHIPYMQYKW